MNLLILLLHTGRHWYRGICRSHWLGYFSIVPRKPLHLRARACLGRGTGCSATPPRIWSHRARLICRTRFFSCFRSIPSILLRFPAGCFRGGPIYWDCLFPWPIFRWPCWTSFREGCFQLESNWLGLCPQAVKAIAPPISACPRLRLPLSALPNDLDCLLKLGHWLATADASILLFFGPA